MGDIFVRYGFPFIDIDGGGNVRGMIAACEDVAHSVPPDTRIIPGHGEVATVADLREYIEMLKSTTALVEQALAAGKTLEQMKQEKLLGAFSARYAPREGLRGHRRLHRIALQFAQDAPAASRAGPAPAVSLRSRALTV